MELGFRSDWGKVTIHSRWKRWYSPAKYFVFITSQAWAVVLGPVWKCFTRFVLRVSSCVDSFFCADFLVLFPLQLFKPWFFLHVWDYLYTRRFNLQHNYSDRRNCLVVSFSMFSDCLQLGHLNVYHIQNKIQDLNVLFSCLFFLSFFLFFFFLSHTRAFSPVWGQWDKTKRPYSMWCCVAPSLLFDSKRCC